MPLSQRAKHKFRFLAALVAACYCFVGLTLSFQHADCAAAETEAALQLRGPNTAHIRMPLQTRAASSRKSLHKPHTCAACEWQANNISPALPAFTLRFAPLSRVRAITTFPRYLRVRSVSTSSRAPPLA